MGGGRRVKKRQVSLTSCTLEPWERSRHWGQGSTPAVTRTKEGLKASVTDLFTEHAHYGLLRVKIFSTPRGCSAVSDRRLPLHSYGVPVPAAEELSGLQLAGGLSVESGGRKDVRHPWGK